MIYVFDHENVLPQYPGREGEAHLEIPALVRLELWLGQAKHQQQWMERKNGEFNVYAERVRIMVNANLN